MASEKIIFPKKYYFFIFFQNKFVLWLQKIKTVIILASVLIIDDCVVLNSTYV